MSSQHPGGSRRRRIAGERRGRALPEDQQTAPAPQPPEARQPATPSPSPEPGEPAKPVALTEPTAEKARSTRRPVLFKERGPKPAASTSAPTTASVTTTTA